MLPFGMSR